MTPTSVVFDLGGVLIDWDPRRAYRQLGGTEAEIDHFLAHVATTEWNHQFDAGRPFADGIAERKALFPEHADWLDAWWSMWPEMLVGAKAETVAVLAELVGAGVPVYGLTNWSAETLPHRARAVRVLGVVRRDRGLGRRRDGQARRRDLPPPRGDAGPGPGPGRSSSTTARPTSRRPGASASTASTSATPPRSGPASRRSTCPSPTPWHRDSPSLRHAGGHRRQRHGRRPDRRLARRPHRRHGPRGRGADLRRRPRRPAARAAVAAGRGAGRRRHAGRPDAGRGDGHGDARRDLDPAVGRGRPGPRPPQRADGPAGEPSRAPDGPGRPGVRRRRGLPLRLAGGAGRVRDRRGADRVRARRRPDGVVHPGPGGEPLRVPLRADAALALGQPHAHPAHHAVGGWPCRRPPRGGARGLRRDVAPTDRPAHAPSPPHAVVDGRRRLRRGPVPLALARP